MEYRTWKKQNGAGESIRTSLLGYGCMRFPTTPEGAIDEPRAEALLNAARDAGVNYFDTAYPYHGGQSEPFVGRVIAKWPRESFYLATKMPLWQCGSLEEARHIFEEQLRRLGVEYIDFYLLHSLHKARYDAAKEMGYHNAISNASDIYSANSFQPPMTIGTVQASPLTMANVYATMGANGVECTPIAITKVTDRSGSKVKVPSANCHQAIDPDIAQTVSYALNQGVVQPGGEASTTQLDNNRKTFAKTGTNENTVIMLERSVRSDDPTAPGGWQITESRNYGETAVFYIESADDDSDIERSDDSAA